MIVAVIVISLIAVSSLLVNFYLVKNIVLPSINIGEEDVFSQSLQYQFQLLLDEGVRETEGDDNEEDVTVAVHDGIAYWMKDSKIHSAPLNDDGEILHEKASPIDVQSMSDGQIDLLMEILDALKEE